MPDREKVILGIEKCTEPGNCEGCPYVSIELTEGCCDYYLMRDALALLEEQRWIPVVVRLPEEKINPNTHDFEYVLCATVFGDVRPFKFGTRIGETQPHFWNGAGYADAYITHWMDMPDPPEPPKEED